MPSYFLNYENKNANNGDILYIVISKEYKIKYKHIKSRARTKEKNGNAEDNAEEIQA